MKLESEGQRAIFDPRGNDLQSAVTLLALPDRTFVILSRSESSYVQAMLVDSNRLALEYREGGPAEHYRSARDDYSSGEVIGILESYRSGEDSWRERHEWRRIDVTERTDLWDRLSPVGRVAGLALFVDAAFAIGKADGDPIFGFEALTVLAIASVVSMTSSIVDLRRYRTMSRMARMWSINSIAVGIMVLTIYCIERFTSR